MKKAIALAASVAMSASLAFTTPVMAQDKGPARDIVEFCAAFGNANNGPGLPTQGSCVSFFRVGGAVALCKELKDFGNLELAGFKSQGECVVFLKDFF